MLFRLAAMGAKALQARSAIRQREAGASGATGPQGGRVGAGIDKQKDADLDKRLRERAGRIGATRADRIALLRHRHPAAVDYPQQ